jgi:carboxymethylenebutenolidase
MAIAASIATELIEIAVADGTKMPAHVARPAGPQTGPGVLVLQDAFGVTGFLRDVAARFAELGFTAIAPALYHRTGGFEFPYDDVEMEQNRKHHKAISTENTLADMTAAHRWLAENPQVDGRIVAIGFCQGGRFALLANAHLSLKAAVSYYGGGIPSKNLDAARAQRAPILMFWGGKDDHIPAEQRRTVADALTEGGATHTQVVFSEAQHGFFCHPRDWCYDADASTQSWAMTLELLRCEGVLDS